MINKIVVEDYTFGKLTWVKLSEILEVAIHHVFGDGGVLQEDVLILLHSLPVSETNNKGYRKVAGGVPEKGELFITIGEDGAVVVEDCKSIHERCVDLEEGT